MVCHGRVCTIHHLVHCSWVRAPKQELGADGLQLQEHGLPLPHAVRHGCSCRYGWHAAHLPACQEHLHNSTYFTAAATLRRHTAFT